MRLFIFMCLLLATTAEASPNGRHKRHLSYLKNLMKSAIFGRSKINIQPQPVLQEGNGYTLFRLPGYDDIMVKVTPKKAVVEEFVYPPKVEKVNLNAFGSIVGTKNKDNTLVAMKEVNNLLSTGILHEGHNNVMKETIVPMFPTLITPNSVVKEKIRTAPIKETRPVLTEIIESRPVLKEVVETKPLLKEVIRPLEERVELNVPFEPIYSYKQTQNNEPVMTYTAHTNPGVELLETIKMKTELPMCIKKRVDEAIILGADRNRFTPVQEVFQYKSQPVVDFSYPRVEANSFTQSAGPNWFAPGQEVYQYQTAPVTDFSYPRVDANSYRQNSFREEMFTQGFETISNFGLPPRRLRPLTDSPGTYSIRAKKIQAKNPRPVPLHMRKSLHFEADMGPQTSKDDVNSQTKKVQAFNYLGEKVDIAQTFGPIPPQYITRVAKKSGNGAVSDEKIMKQMKVEPIVGSKDNVANANIPINVYKSQRNPNTGKMANENSPLRTNEETRVNQYIATHVLAPNSDNAEVKNVVFTNKVTAKPPSVTAPVVVASTSAPKQPLRENTQTSLPVVNQYVATHVLASNSDNAQVKNVVFTNKVIAKPPSVTTPVVVASTSAPKQPLRENTQTSLKSIPVVNQYIATHVLAPNSDNAEVKNVVFTNKVIAKPPSVTTPVVVASTSAPKQQLREDTQTSLKSIPVVNQYIATHVLAPNSDNAEVKNVVFTNKVIAKPPSVTTPVVVASTSAPKQTFRENTQTSLPVVNQYIATQVLAPKSDNVQVKNVVFTNKVTASPPSVTTPIVVASTNAPKLPLRENIQTSLKSIPVVAKHNESYTYKQKNADGSSLNVKGDKHGVSVSVKENNNRGRGDIPDQ